MIKRLKFVILLIFIFSGCEPEEIPITIEGVVNYIQIDIGQDYCYQKYYDIENNIIVGENLNTDWDLAFSSTNNSIMLNSSRYMRIIPIIGGIGVVTIEELIKNETWLYDNPNGNVESLAFNNGGKELSRNYFLIDQGYDCNTTHLGYSIIRIIDYNEYAYFIQVITINNNTWDYGEIIEIVRTENEQNIYFSLHDNTITNIVSSEWDLCFSRYTEFNVLPPSANSNSEPLPTYRVVGVLQNSHVSVAVDTTNPFSEISSLELNNYEFESSANTIGYDWKYYNAVLGVYSIDSPVYVIQTSSFNYYKLLFLDFYNLQGEKGAPMFQIEKIEL